MEFKLDPGARCLMMEPMRSAAMVTIMMLRVMQMERKQKIQRQASINKVAEGPRCVDVTAHIMHSALPSQDWRLGFGPRQPTFGMGLLITALLRWDLGTDPRHIEEPTLNTECQESGIGQSPAGEARYVRSVCRLGQLRRCSLSLRIVHLACRSQYCFLCGGRAAARDAEEALTKAWKTSPGGHHLHLNSARLLSPDKAVIQGIPNVSRMLTAP